MKNFTKLNKFSYDIVLIPKKHLLGKKMQVLLKDIEKMAKFLREIDEKSSN